MKNKLTNIIITVLFLAILFGFALANIIKTDETISYAERRKLSQSPEFTFADLFDGDYFDNKESYWLDQFYQRDFFRSVKAYFKKYAALQFDNNGVFLADRGLYKLNYRLNENSVKLAAQKFNAIAEKYFKDCNVRFSVVPDKNYYLSDNIYLKLDCDKVIEIMNNQARGMRYINLADKLETNDFYKSDLHWSQDKILKIADAVLQSFGRNTVSDRFYSVKELSPFYGSYYGQAALYGEADILKYLFNDVIMSLTVYDYETNSTLKVYDDSLINSVDGYSVFLGGAKALMRIDNPCQNNGKTLYIFRDSLASSLTPLLAQEYQTVYLIDLRYISEDSLSDYIEFKVGSDVLFLNGAELLNRAEILK